MQLLKLENNNFTGRFVNHVKVCCIEWYFVHVSYSFVVSTQHLCVKKGGVGYIQLKFGVFV